MAYRKKLKKVDLDTGIKQKFYDDVMEILFDVLHKNSEEEYEGGVKLKSKRIIKKPSKSKKISKKVE